MRIEEREREKTIIEFNNFKKEFSLFLLDFRIINGIKMILSNSLFFQIEPDFS